MTGLFERLLILCLNDSNYRKQYSNIEHNLLLFYFMIILGLLICYPFVIMNISNIYINCIIYVLTALLLINWLFSAKIRKQYVNYDLYVIKNRINSLIVIVNSFIDEFATEELDRAHIFKMIISEGEDIINKEKKVITFSNPQTLIIIPLMLTIVNPIIERIDHNFILSWLIIISYALMGFYAVKHMVIALTNIPCRFEKERLLSYLKLINT